MQSQDSSLPQEPLQLVPIGGDAPLVGDDDTFEIRDDKGKISRWQIGNSSLGVLERVYQMDPFPGAPLGLPHRAPPPSARNACGGLCISRMGCRVILRRCSGVCNSVRSLTRCWNWRDAISLGSNFGKIYISKPDGSLSTPSTWH